MSSSLATAQRISRIWSVNEWGRLREVILGNPAGSWLPSLNDISQRSFDRDHLTESHSAGQPMPGGIIEETLEDLADLAGALRDLGVQVHQAEGLSSMSPVQTPDWEAEPESAINIRDITLIHGDLMVDAPSPTRGRAFETHAVRALLQEAGEARTTWWHLHGPDYSMRRTISPESGASMIWKRCSMQRTVFVWEATSCWI